MAFDTAFLENPRTGQMRTAPLGFSWTTFFFGPFPMMFRGAWKWFFIVLVTALITYGLANLVWMFIINRLHFNDLLKDGYKFKAANRTSYAEVGNYARGPVPALDETAAV